MDVYEALFGDKDEGKKAGQFITKDGRVIFIGGPSSGGGGTSGGSVLQQRNFSDTAESPLKGQFSEQHFVASGKGAVFAATDADGNRIYVGVDYNYEPGGGSYNVREGQIGRASCRERV